MSTRNCPTAPKKPPQRSASSRCAPKSGTAPQQPMTRTPTPTDDEVESGVDNEEIDKQLVMWAGRLELESIDLRDKSRGLIAELHDNSETLRSTTSHLTSAIKLLTSVSKTTDKAHPEQLKKIATKLTEMQSSVLQLSGRLYESNTTTVAKIDREFMKKLDKISSEVGAMSGKGKGKGGNARATLSKNAIAEVSPKLLEIIGLGKESRERQNQTIQLLGSFRDEVNEISGRLTDIHSLQVAFSEQLIGVSKAQESMIREFRSLKERINGETATSLPMSPDSSLINKPPIYSKRYRSQQRTRLERRLLQKSSAATSTTNDSSYICLLSDDNTIPEI